MVIGKIITHTPPRHADDFLALALLRDRYEGVPVEFLHPRRILPSHIDDPHCLILDVGGAYDPERLNFGHHHDIALPCCLHMIINHFFPMHREWLEHPAIRDIDRLDRLHAEAGHQRMTPEAWAKRAIILRIDTGTHAALIVNELRAALAGSRNSRGFWLSFYEALEGHNILDEALLQTRAEALRYHDLLGRSIRAPVGHYQVGFSREGVGLNVYTFMRDVQCDFLVEPDILDPTHTAIYAGDWGDTVEQVFDFPKGMVFYRSADDRILVIDKRFETVTANWLKSRLRSDTVS